MYETFKHGFAQVVLIFCYAFILLNISDNLSQTLPMTFRSEEQIVQYKRVYD